MGLLVAMVVCNALLIFGTALTLVDGHENDAIEEKASQHVYLLLESIDDKLEPHTVGLTAHNILVEVNDAITEQNPMLSYEKTQIAYQKVKSYVLTSSDKPVLLRQPEQERPTLRAVK